MKRIVLFVVCLFYSLLIIGQVPGSFNYQATLRNADGELMTNQEVNLRISLLQGSEAGLSVYTETHAVTTNDYGLVNLKIGQGTDPTSDFSMIEWNENNYFLSIEIMDAAGSGYISLGASELQSVPYSIYSNNSINSLYSDTSDIARSLDNKILYFSDSDTLFAVKDREGNVVFAVFPDGVKVFVDETKKRNVGGFAVSGRGTGKGNLDFFSITPDSARITLNENAKGQPGGFAVSGRGTGKNILNHYLQVTPDSTRIFIKEGLKGQVGGFAVSGRGTGKSSFNDIFNVSPNAFAEVINNESRVMWYPEKSAFLAGEIQVESPDDVGENSIALGYRCKARGDWSQAFGYETVTHGAYATAIGWQAEAETNSFAFGYQTKALGNDAIALGSGAQAIADKSFAFGSTGIDSLGITTGQNTRATGEYAYAIGLGCEASKKGAFALGANNIASGEFSTALGFNTTATKWYSTATGARTKADGYYSTAMGFKSEALATASMAIGFDSRATGYGSLAMGINNLASGNQSVALGVSTVAEGTSATALGFRTAASGDFSLAMGDNTQASGRWSLASGFETIASNLYSTALGRGTIAKNFGVFVIGQHNEEVGTTVQYPLGTNPLFVLGNGLDKNTRSNAMEVYWDGTLKVYGEILNPSDSTLKENIEPVGNVLPKVLQINPVYFTFKDDLYDQPKRHIGFIAQEVQPLFPELVRTDSNNKLSFSYAKMTAVLLKAVKEQQQVIDEQQQKQYELENKINRLEEKIEMIMNQIE